MYRYSVKERNSP